MKRMAMGILLAAVAAFAGTAGAAAVPETMLARVRVLAGPDLAGRGAGSCGGHAAGDTVARWFAAAGLQPACRGSWFQEFPLYGQGWSGQPLDGRTGRNVAGILPGSGPLATRYVLVSAHYDHLGRSDGDSTCAPPAPDAYYPGANDNASGVTVLVDLALHARRGGAGQAEVRRSVLFVSFDGEEVGLQGSAYMAGHMPVPLDSLDAVINMDTVGQMGQGKLYVSGIGTTAAFAGIARAAGWQGLDLSLAPGGWSGSDHMTFDRLHVPVLFLFGGPYPQYNRPADTWDSLDSLALDKVAHYAGALLDLVRQEAGPLPWRETAPPEAAVETAVEGNRRTWLGTMPDFDSGVSGYKIGGVFDGSPAAAAGLAAGDVLVRLGGKEVTDLATFTRALRSFDPGSPVEITVLRGGRSLNFTVVLGDRSDRR